MTQSSALADERAKFEAWIKDKHGVSKKSNPWPVWVDENDGTYVYSQEEWEAWQGRAALAQEGQTKRLFADEEDMAILEAVRRELDEGDGGGNAPGHGHEVPGIWDAENGDLSGKPCAWCLTWAKFTKLAAAPQPKGQT